MTNKDIENRIKKAITDCLHDNNILDNFTIKIAPTNEHTGLYVKYRVDVLGLDFEQKKVLFNKLNDYAKVYQIDFCTWWFYIFK